MAAAPRQVRLVDATGRCVRQLPAAQATLTVPTAALPAGVYVVQIDYAQRSESHRVVVQP